MSASTTQYDDLPTVSLNTERAQLTRELVDICRDIGFFRLVDFEQEILARYESIRRRMRQFFALDQAAKDRYYRQDMQGYLACWQTAFNRNDPDPRELLAYRGYLETDWPVPGLRDEVHAMQGLLRPIALEVLAALADGLGVPRVSFTRLLDPSSWTCAGHNYLAMNQLDRRRLTLDGDRYLRLGTHADTSLLTFVINDRPGLEVQHQRTGEWIAARHGGLTVNIGDALMYATNDTLVSTQHRVRASAEDMRSQRFTCSFLYYPGRRTSIAAVPGGAIRERNRGGGVNLSIPFEEFQTAIYESQRSRPGQPD